MKQQEIFDAASVHLMGMDGPSLDQDSDACVYRGKDEDCEFNGKMCAVGLFIKDEHYDCGFEGNDLNRNGDSDIANAVAKSWGQYRLSDDQLGLLADLQMAHDDTSSNIPLHDFGYPDDTWSKSIVAALEGVANKFQLRFNPKGASA